MGSKKRRQRGSRTHSGGTHKNRRGAGHRGGRGAAGRDKHEFHNYEPLGKHGFTRPDSITDSVEEIRIQKIDEDIALYADDGTAESDGDAYVIDARDVVDAGHDVDVVKVLGGGQVRNELVVTADAFTAGAVAGIEEAGGDAVLSERAEEAEDDEAEDVNDERSDES
ncbi:uL15m family ribosomal protein [Halohasta litorea]|uniref:Large ribosomal subunit protein uL15 n=1 Tax=Halohasta litorea TaxID=869891 RepID=A0ABD6DBH9_9EURY|nr:uL15m family ribosomal protein [Halohasta litorea]